MPRMTTNAERAADLIYSHMSSWDDESQAVNASQALAEAGLLEPDPPATQIRTLADMTPEERQARIGMWCDNLVSAAKVPAPVVLACVQGGYCWVLHTNLFGERSRFLLEDIVPRLDIPRAWNSDGTPPA